jgi:tetratricopeptide (TPR) repeat protein
VAPQPSDLLEEALLLHRRGAVAEAATRYSALLQAEPHHADAHYYLGLIACQQGRFDDGAQRARQALSGDPRHAPAHVLLGRALAALGQHEEALTSFDRALALAPESAQAHGHRADVLSDLGRHGEAVEAYDRALAAAPDRVEDWFNRGTALAALDRHGEAVASFERAIAGRPDDARAYVAQAKSLSEEGLHEASLGAIERALAMAPNFAEAWQGRGNVCLALKRYDDASSAFDKALALRPEFAEAWLGRGNVCLELTRYDDALSAFDKALALKPKFAEAWLGRGNVFRNIERPGDAFNAYDTALALKPDLAAAYLGRGNLFAKLKRYDEALAAYDNARALKPDQSWLGRGNVFAELKRYDEALAAYDKALTLKPDLAEAHLNEGFLRLSLGELTEGWRKYEYRWQISSAVGLKRKFHQPLWLGDSDIANKTILVHAEQGFGDTLLGCRYIPMVAQLGARVVAEAGTPLKPLLKNLEGISTLIAQGETIPHFDVHCPIMSLPLAFKTTMQTIPARIPYLAAAKDSVEKWRSELIGKDIKVGIGWAGSTSFPHDRDRSILLNNLLPALGVKGIRYFSIQKNLRQGDEDLLDANPQIIRLDRKINDFHDTAAIMMSLDLVISSDTSIVNLAGALGRPFWVLLHYTPDWRWLACGKATPWYPTGRLFRQKTIGDWRTVTDEVRAELEKLVAGR